MSYLRTNGRFSGRVSGRWGGASVEGRYQLGDIADTGGGLAVVGDPVLALLAQLNRFAGKSFSLVCGGSSAKVARRWVSTPFELTPVLSDAAATAAALIVYDRYNCVPIDTLDAGKLKWASNAIGGDSRAWALANIRELVTTIALFGDSLGLPPAPSSQTAGGGVTPTQPGITDLFKGKGKLDTTQIVLLGGVAVAGILLLTRQKRKR